MAFGGFENGKNGQVLVEINTTPLVDVMLVLLIVFIITAPVMTHSVKVDLPKASAKADGQQGQRVTLVLTREGATQWNDTAVNATQLETNLQSLARQHPEAVLEVHADRAISYERVAQVMSAAQRTGIIHIGLVTQPHQ